MSINYFLEDEMCDTCGETKEYGELYELKGQLLMREGLCLLNPVTAICIKCQENKK